MEVWKPIPGYEGHYEASNSGLIRSVDRVVVLKTKHFEDRPCNFKSKVLKPNKKKGRRSNIKERLEVALSVNGKLKTFAVHTLIARTFLENPNNYNNVNHKNGNPFDNNLDNLEWCSKLENNRHAFKNGLVKTQKPVAQIDIKTGKVIKVYPGESEACRRVGIAQGKIGRAISRNGTSCGYKWKYVDIDNESVTTIENWIGFQ